MTKKQTFDTRSTMNNWTSYVPNTSSSSGHKGWRKSVSAKSAKLTALTGFCQTSTLANLNDQDLKLRCVENESNYFIVEQVSK